MQTLLKFTTTTIKMEEHRLDSDAAIMTAALIGLKVLDLSENISGQYCARLFRDYGADVTLVEPPDGSIIRRLGPFAPDEPCDSLLFFHLNLGKRSVTFDRSSDAWRDTLADLVRGMDVVVLGPQSRQDKSAITAANPLAVVGVLDDFDGDTPFSSWKGGELIVQALSGMMHNNGEIGHEPLYGYGHRSAYAAGVVAYVGLTGAVFARIRDGTGQVVSVDAVETAASQAFPYVVQHLYNGVTRSRGDQIQSSGQVHCRDGWVCIWIYNHRFADVCKVLGLETLIDDPRFAVSRQRREHWGELFAAIQAAAANWSATELVAALQAVQVIAAKAPRPSELFLDPHLSARGFWQNVPVGSGMRPILGPQFRLSASPRLSPQPAPAIGEANSDHLTPHREMTS
jgi:crotonobetainyl-CoA:carnitine CoA-transferase CaiB-like acyl-CoA transferase